jgi:hypothetical protein
MITGIATLPMGRSVARQAREREGQTVFGVGQPQAASRGRCPAPVPTALVAVPAGEPAMRSVTALRATAERPGAGSRARQKV